MMQSETARARLMSAAMLLLVLIALVLVLIALAGCESWQGMTPAEQADAIDQAAAVVQTGAAAVAPVTGPAAPLVLLGSNLATLLLTWVAARKRGEVVTARRIVEPIEAARLHSDAEVDAAVERGDEVLTLNGTALRIGHIATGVRDRVKRARWS